MEAAAVIRRSPSNTPRPKSTSLATSDGRMKALTHLARLLAKRIDQIHDGGASFNSEAKELRETLKQLAAESEGRGDAGGDESALDRIREILSDQIGPLGDPDSVGAGPSCSSQLDLFPEERPGQ
jgi:hypothetical protein